MNQEELAEIFLQGQCFNFAPELAKCLHEKGYRVSLEVILGTRLNKWGEDEHVCIHAYVSFADVTGTDVSMDVKKVITEDDKDAIRTTWRSICRQNQEKTLSVWGALYRLDQADIYWRDLEPSGSTFSEEFAAKAKELILSNVQNDQFPWGRFL